MPYDPEKHERRSLRLPGYDYAQSGAYFATACSHNRACLFGDVVDETMHLNAFGRIVRDVWNAIPAHFSNVRMDAFVVMPNHVHGIIVIVDDTVVGATHASPLRVATGPDDMPRRPNGPKPGPLGAIVGSFKSAATRRINAHCETPGAKVWQPGAAVFIIGVQLFLEVPRRPRPPRSNATCAASPRSARPARLRRRRRTTPRWRTC